MQENGDLSYSIQDEALKAAEAIRMGKVILYPTDTIWGLGCDIFNENAVKRIYEIKERPLNKPFILLVSNLEMLKRYVFIHPRVETLLVYHQKPLTLIYPKVEHLPDYLCGEDGSIAIRLTHDSFCQYLINKIDKPIISTSANLGGQPFPQNFSDVSSEIKEMVDYTVELNIVKSDEEAQPSIIATFNHKGELNFIRT